MKPLKIGELCAGYGGLGMAVEEVFGAELAWVSEFDEAPSKILAHHWPDVPNHGDMTKIDWAAIEPVDIISGGTPCQDLSHAGRRAGMTEGTRSNLWVQMREAIATIKPTYVVWENVRGAYSAEANSSLESCPGCLGDTTDGRVFLRALGRVLGDLSDLGYDCQWRGLRAADVGAPHGRFRVFILATHRDGFRRKRARDSRGRGPGFEDGSASFADTKGERRHDGHPGNLRAASRGINLPINAGHATARALGAPAETQWGEYEHAIRRWESVLGRRAPASTEPTGRKGGHMLSARFAEWMMGVPDGWIVDVPGISRNEALKAAGNGVVPQQAAAALRDMLGYQAEAVA